jgi:hypothetical protein
MQLSWRGACSTPVTWLHLLCASERGFCHGYVVIPRTSFTDRHLKRGLTASSVMVWLLLANHSHAVMKNMRHCATRRKVAGSIPDWVLGIFHWLNLSGRTMALESTQPLTEMSTRNISWGAKGGWCAGLTTCHLRVPIVLKFGSLNLLEPSRPVRACTGIVQPFFFYRSGKWHTF